MVSLIIKVKKILQDYCHKKESINKDYKYKSLTPIDYADNGEYSKALYQGLKEHMIKNIAVTGPYGSGKSSVLRTFEREFQGKEGFEFLNISLATFNDSNKTESESAIQSKDRIQANNSIEKSLLQQIIFKVSGDELVDSNFSRIFLKSTWTNFGLALLLISWLVSILFISKPNHDIFKDNVFFSKEYIWFFQCSVFFLTVCILQHFMNLVPRLRLNKLGIASAEISFNENKGDSVLNKYLDELIYFFSKTKYNILIIEDLDRFENKEVFVNLRELNTLLNNSEEVKKRKKCIKFVYALGDDVFENIDRTKFFDFIIPIIPVINSSNASEKLRGEINGAFPENAIPSDFFDEVTLYIDDMRMLLNITNEFVIYRKKLDEVSKITLHDKKLLALIIYKNIFPHDFVELNFRRGIVANAFAKKVEFQLSIINKLKEVNADLEKQIAEIERESIISFNELKNLYLAKYFEELPNATRIYIPDRNDYLSFSRILNENLFDSLIKIDNFQFYNESNQRIPISKKFTEIERLVDKSVTYAERVALITSKSNGKTASCKLMIKQNSKKIELIGNLKLCELMEKYPDEGFFEINGKLDLSGKSDLRLIKFLIADGYIEEDYESYMSFFYEGEVSKADQQFLISVTSHEPLDFAYKLSNVEKIAGKLKLERYGSKSILNFDLFDYLIINNPHSNALARALSVIVDHEKLGFIFTYRYLTKRSNERAFVERLSKLNLSHWEEILESKELQESQKQKLLTKLLNNISIKTLSDANEKGYFTNLISEHKLVFEVMKEIRFEQSREIVKSQNIKFTDLTSCRDRRLLDFIEENDAYNISDINIEVILRNKDGEKGNVTPNYTAIIDSGKFNLISYVNNNINEYVRNVLLRLDTNSESEASIVKLLNHEDLLDVNAISLINTVNFKIKKINSIENKALWVRLISNMRLIPTWENVLNYFEYSNRVLDENIINYLNLKSNCEQLSNQKLEPDQKTEALSDEIIGCDKLSDSNYHILVSAIPYDYPDIKTKLISKQKLLALLGNQKLQLNESNYLFAKEQLGFICVALIELNIDKFLTDSENYDIEMEGYQKLLQSKMINLNDKIRIIKTITRTTIEGDVELSKYISEYVVKEITDPVFEWEVLESLISQNIGKDNKIVLFNQHAKGLSVDQVINLISIFGYPISGLRQNKKPSLDVSNDNLVFVDILKSKSLISGEPKDGKLKLYPKKKLIL